MSDTSVKFFHSGMLNAPVLNGVAGSLVSVLDACLKDGFDVKAVTALTVASGVATMTFSGTHSAVVGSVIYVSGASVAALNGEQRVVSVGAGSLTFATSAADGAASGSVSFKMAPLGWTKPFAGTNKGAYQSAALASPKFFLRVDDSDPQVASVRGYETMTDVDTGVAPFPTDTQLNGGGYWGKSNSANTNAIGWTLIGDGQVFYLHTSIYQGYGSSYANYVNGSVLGFGDMVSSRAQGDGYACAIACATSDWQNYSWSAGFDANYTSHSKYIYTPRGYGGLGSSQPMSSAPYSGSLSALSGCDTTLGVFPSPVDGSLLLSARFLMQPNISNAPRCDIPGVYTCPQSNLVLTLSHRSVLAGSGALAGRTLMALAVSVYTSGDPTSSVVSGLTFFDITGPWR